jgi:hypothetical protein
MLKQITRRIFLKSSIASGLTLTMSFSRARSANIMIFALPLSIFVVTAESILTHI